MKKEEEEEEEYQEEEREEEDDSLEHGQAPVASLFKKTKSFLPTDPPEALSCGEVHFSILITF